MGDKTAIESSMLGAVALAPPLIVHGADAIARDHPPCGRR
jgi:hypothetical protein